MRIGSDIDGGARDRITAIGLIPDPGRIPDLDLVTVEERRR
jgi:hypothetical protein